jgi:2,3-bisphosphoglycerate-independent phosphoglycerate mutase
MDEEMDVDIPDPIPQLVQEGGKIVLIVLDGLGGFRSSEHPSEIFAANTPNLDALASEGSIGLHIPVAPGITPGSGAGHLALFGYDPLRWDIGRGALSAAGLGIDLKQGDIAARVNFCRLADGIVQDRRAGRLPTNEAERLAGLVTQGVDLDLEVELRSEKEHRGVLVLRGEGLSPFVSDTDPGADGKPPLDPEPRDSDDESSVRTAKLIQDFINQAGRILADEKANFLLLRGIEGKVNIPTMGERYGLRASALASYPTYLGIARILGMSATEIDLPGAAKAIETSWENHDFFFVHYKPTDSAGEDGDFDAKVAAIEAADREIPALLSGNPEVVCVTGDHSTPSQMRSHSWHPVPFLMSGHRVGQDTQTAFDEESARQGGFGEREATDLMPLMLAAASRLRKYGA